MKKKELEKKEIEKILKLSKQGESIRSICKVLGYSQSLIQRVLNENDKKNIFNPKKNYIAICKKTNKIFKDYKNSSGSLTSHIKKEYPEIDIPSKYIRKKFEIENGKTWYENFFLIKEEDKEVVKKMKCKFCNWETADLDNISGSYTKHISNEHNMEIDKYLEIFSEDKNLFITFLNNKNYKKENESKKENYIECKVCNEKMRKITNTHLKKHGLSLKNYKNKFGNTMSKRTKDKFVKIGEKNSHSIVMTKKNTGIELKIKEILDKLKIKYIQQYKKDNYYFDFFLTEKEILLEIDGNFWHGYDRDSNWDYSVFNNVINDYKKSLNQKNLFRIDGDLINKIDANNFIEKDCFYTFLNKNNLNIKNHKIFNLKENDIIFSKEYCINKFDINNKNTIKLIDNILFLWKEFYNPNKFKNFIDLEKRTNVDFRIKGIFFKEFYSAHKIKNKNIFELFKSDDILRKTIVYRLGINNSKEYFDFNIKNLYRGIEVRTLFNVGIFPVKKAKEIFENNVEFGQNIFDPFMGWGSRMISLKDIIENKKCNYIGNDSNQNLISGYNHIIKNELGDKFKKKITIKIKDSTEFDFELKDSIDFIFTSPPFYNDEIYKKDTILFNSIEDWGESLIFPVFKNCFCYLKTGKKMIIDMKGLYCQEVINCALKCGFKLEKVEDYKITKTHYGNRNMAKKQSLISFIKP